MILTLVVLAATCTAAVVTGERAWRSDARNRRRYVRENGAPR
jgi:hypothetical protein